MHTNVRLTNKRRIHTQSNYTNTKLKAWFRRLLRIRPGNGAGLLYTVHPGTHTGEFVVDRTANVLMPALTAYNVTAVSQVLKPRVALRGPSVPRTRQSTRTDGRTDGHTTSSKRDQRSAPALLCARVTSSIVPWCTAHARRRRKWAIGRVQREAGFPSKRNARNELTQFPKLRKARPIGTELSSIQLNSSF